MVTLVKQLGLQVLESYSRARDSNNCVLGHSDRCAERLGFGEWWPAVSR